MSVALDRYILTVLKMPSQGIKTELVTRLNNLSGLSGTPMSPMLTKWIQQNFGLSSVAAIQNWSAGKFSPDMLLRWNSVFPSQFEGSVIRTELYDALTGGGVVPPVANFSGSPTTVYPGDTVAFTDLSTNTPTSWSWSFAGGTPATSTTQNPSVVYNTAGTYGVDLTATNAGGSDLESKPNYITVNNFLLDAYPNATAAYGMRKLKSTATVAIRVRRSSDNTEQDIGFVGINLDVAALSSFVGANNGFITRWYDQTGQSREFGQLTASVQPRIVNAGVIDMANGIPSIFFGEATIKYMETFNSAEPAFDFTNTFSLYMALKPANQSGAQVAFGKGTGLFGQDAYYAVFDPTTNVGVCVLNNNTTSPTSQSLTASGNANLGVYGWNLSAGNGIASFNGTINNSYSGLISAKLNGSNPIIGVYQTFASATDFDGWFSEMIVYPTDQSANRVGIETNIKNYYGI